MAQTSHTAGPWKRRKGKPRIVINEHGVTICTAVLYNNPGGNDKDRDVAIANAKLIAAAPDMLAVLKDILALIENTQGITGFHLNGDVAEWSEFDDLIYDAVKAIKKAIGETQ